MIGWLGDFFRFWWALFYWNARKTWFRLRGAHRDSCPCQTFSDSGLALDSRCEAVITWNRPHRFRKVCPLLTETPDGWRCGADAERVRPFWGRALFFGGIAALSLYLLAAGGVFAALRLAHYEIGFKTIVSPWRWSEIIEAQEKLYANRAQQAMATGNYHEAILALERVCQLNPLNYEAGLALASLTQVASHPSLADLTYERLIRTIPEKRVPTSRIWFRSLLARGDYAKLKPIAASMLLEDVSERNVWLNALLFSARLTKDAAILNTPLNQRHDLPAWCVELLEIERDLLTNHLDEALPRLRRIPRQVDESYQAYYQVDRLIRLRRPEDALDVLNNYNSSLTRDESGFLRLHIYRSSNWTSMLGVEFDARLKNQLNAATVARFCAYLVTYPDRNACRRFGESFRQTYPQPTTETLPLFRAVYLAANLSNHAPLAEQMLAQIKEFSGSDARVLTGLSELLTQTEPDTRLSRILPLVPLPIELIYAVLEKPVAAHP